MLMADIITFLKIGSNIILAILGFISFEDVYNKNVNDVDSLFIQPKYENCVELIPQTELNTQNKTYYANWIYFTQENPH